MQNPEPRAAAAPENTAASGTVAAPENTAAPESTVAAALEKIKKALLSSGYYTQPEEVQSIAAWLLCQELGCSLTELPLHRREEFDFCRIEPAFSRLVQGEPIQYVLGQTWFMGLELQVAPGVLIPRFDSEVIVEAVTELPLPKQGIAADICTGSGALALAFASLMPEWQVYATDISPEALAVAEKNTEALGLTGQVSLYQGDLIQPLLDLGIKADVVLCNPPYIPSREVAELSYQVRQEPKLALDGGEDGLEYYVRLSRLLPRIMKEGAYLSIEHGDTQGEAVGCCLTQQGFRLLRPLQDLAGRSRGWLAQLCSDTGSR